MLNNMKLTGIFFLLVVGSISISLGQEKQVLNLTEAIKIGLENNVTLQQAQNQQYINQANKISSLASIAPSVGISSSLYRLKGNQFIEQEGRPINNAQTMNFDASINAEMTLFGGLERWNIIAMSESAVDGQMETIKWTRQDVMRNIANMYLQVLLDQELLAIASENLETQKTQFRQLQQMVELGSRAMVDQITQEAVVKQAEVQVLRAQNSLLNDKMLLSQLLLIDPEIDFVLAEPEWENIVTDPELSETELLSIALENRGDYKASLYNEEAAKHNYRAIKSNHFPTISAFYSSGSFYSDASVPAFRDQFDSNLRTLYGVSLNIPIFGGMQRYASTVQAKVQHKNAELRSKELNNLVKSQVIQAIRNYKDAVLNYDATSSSLEASEMSYHLEQERFNLGVTDLVQYAQANQSLVKAKADYAQAKYTLAFQEILLNYATGTLTIEDIPE